MNKLKFLMVTGLLAATAACNQTGPNNPYAYNNGYNTRPANNNAYNPSNNPYNSGYNNNAAYYNNNPSYNPNGNPYSRATSQRGPNGDYDRDGIPNRNDIDANGDRIPDAFQR